MPGGEPRATVRMHVGFNELVYSFACTYMYILRRFLRSSEKSSTELISSALATHFGLFAIHKLEWCSSFSWSHYITQLLMN